MKAFMAAWLALTVLVAGACSDPEPSPSEPGYEESALASVTVAAASGARTGFGFSGTVGEAVSLTGGGSFNLITATDAVPSETDVASGGGFRCVAAVTQGPLAGCATDEGVRWNAVQLLATTGFRCSGADAVKNAATAEEAVVLLADFYRAGDGIKKSFTAKMIVSTADIAADVPGVQTLWVQGAGCGDAAVNFSR